MKVVSSPPLVPRRSQKRSPGVMVGAVVLGAVAYFVASAIFGVLLLGGLSVIEDTSEWSNPLGFWDCLALVALFLPFVALIRAGE